MEGATAATGMAAVLEGTTTITSLVGSIFDMITGNPVLVVVLSASLLTVGISVFKKIKRASK